MSQPKRISGRDNPEFKRFLAVRARRNRDLILVEGPKLLAEAVRSNLAVEVVAFAEDAAGEALSLHSAFPARRTVRFAASLMKSLADVETHQGVLALVERPRPSTDWLQTARPFVVILDGVQDPGNVGALFRTAEAAGVSGLLLTKGCADPLSPKALRASAGSAFRIPHVCDLQVAPLLTLLPDSVRLVAAVAGPGARSLFEASLDLPLAVALGSEGSGLSAELEAAVRERFRIPLARDVESLNVAVAGAVVMFEVASRAGILRN